MGIDDKIEKFIPAPLLKFKGLVVIYFPIYFDLTDVVIIDVEGG